MKKLLLIVTTLVLLLGSSCNKDYNTYVTNPVNEELKTGDNTSNTITDKTKIDDQSVWTFVARAPFGNPDIRWFKFESNGKYVISNVDIKDYYWKTDKYYEGSKHSGTDVKGFMK